MYIRDKLTKKKKLANNLIGSAFLQLNFFFFFYVLFLTSTPFFGWLPLWSPACSYHLELVPAVSSWSFIPSTETSYSDPLPHSFSLSEYLLYLSLFPFSLCHHALTILAVFSFTFALANSKRWTRWVRSRFQARQRGREHTGIKWADEKFITGNMVS